MKKCANYEGCRTYVKDNKTFCAPCEAALENLFVSEWPLTKAKREKQQQQATLQKQKGGRDENR